MGARLGPLVAGVLGALGAIVWDRRLAVVLVPAPILYVLFMGTQERFFGRWLMPVFPILCLLAAWAVVRGAEALAAARRCCARRSTCSARCCCSARASCSRSTTGSSSRGPTRATSPARGWRRTCRPRRRSSSSRSSPTRGRSDIGRPSPGTSNGARWIKFPTSRSNVANDGSIVPGEGRIVNIEDFERTLFPGLVDRYEKEGWCYVVSGSTQRGRADVAPKEVPQAIAYYKALERRADVVFHASPYRRGARR